MVRIADIMAWTGYSRITVSGVLNDRYRKMGITEATAEKIRTAAKRLGYVPNDMALNMKSGRSTAIGCYITTLHFDWGGRLLEGTLEHARSTKYSISIDAGLGLNNEESAVNDFVRARVSGLLFYNVHPNPITIQHIHAMLSRYAIPSVASNCPLALSSHIVEADNQGAAAMAVEHLVHLGHQRIAYVGGSDFAASYARRDGYIDQMQRSGLPIEAGYLNHMAGWGVDQAEEATVRMLREVKIRPSAIVGANHHVAAAALRAAINTGLKVPGDISVIGITDSTMCEVTNPALTVVSTNEFSIGSSAVEMLIELIEGRLPKGEPCRRRVPCSLVPRHSTAAPG